MTKTISQKGEGDGLDFDVMSDVLVRLRAPESGDAPVYMMGVVNGLRREIARLRALQADALQRAYAREATELRDALFPHGHAGAHISAHGHAASTLHKFLDSIAQLPPAAEPAPLTPEEQAAAISKAKELLGQHVTPRQSDYRYVSAGEPEKQQ